MGDYATGIYLFTVWASATDASAVAVREYAVRVFGREYITELGKYNHQLNFGAFLEAARDAIDNGASPTEPSKAELNGAILQAAGSVPSLLDAILGTGAELGREVPGAIKAVGEWSTGIVVAVAIVAVVVGVIYLGQNAKGLKIGVTK